MREQSGGVEEGEGEGEGGSRGEEIDGGRLGNRKRKGAGYVKEEEEGGWVCERGRGGGLGM